MKFDLSDFLELDTKALLAVNGGASCSGGSCSSSVSKNTGSCGSSGSSYSGSCSSTGGSSYGGSCGTSGGNCSSSGGSFSGSNGGSGNENQPKETTPSYNIVGNSYAEVANAKPGDKMKKGDAYVTLTQGDIDWAKAQLEKNATNSESTKTDTELNEIIGVGSCSSYNVGTSNGGGGNNNQPKETTPSYNIVGNSYAEVANAKPGDKMKKGDAYVTLTQGDIDWAKAQLEKNATNSESTKTDTELNEIIGVGSCGGACGGVGTGDTGDMGNNGEVEGVNGGEVENSNKSAEEKISASIQENNDKQYNYDTGYRCDNWVEEVLNDAGYDASDYLTAGNSYEKTVQQHIDALTSTKKEGVDYTMTLPSADGAYVVFMDDGKDSNGKAINEHAAILVIKEGIATVWDNSSGNGGNPVYKTDANGNKVVSYYDKGVSFTSVKNNSMTPTWMYSTYYYQKIQ